MLDTDDLEMIRTGPVAAFFGPCHGPLPYRLEFRHETYEQTTVQPTGTVNYPGESPRAEGGPYCDVDRVVAQALTTCAGLTGERDLAVRGAAS